MSNGLAPNVLRASGAPQDDPLKLYCVFSQEALDKMGGNRGKLAAQAGHAFLHCTWDAPKELVHEYRSSQLAFKITLVAPTTADLLRLVELHANSTGVTLVEDAGRTVFKEPTITCVGIGPIRPSQRSEFLASLRVLI